jgi:uncharacterized membrane protein
MEACFMLTRHSIVILIAVAVLAACPRATQAPAPASDVANVKETPAMNDSKATAASQPPKGKRAAGQENEPVQAFRGFGTEPLWGARGEGDTLLFTTPENQEGTVMHGRRVPSLVGFVFIGKDGDRDFHLGLTPGECSDGMSDNRYEYVATFIYGDTTYKGCGEAAK